MDFACWLHNRAWMVRRCSASRVKRCCEHPDHFLFASDLSIPYLDIGSISSSFLDCGYIGYVCFKSSYGQVFSFQMYEILLQFKNMSSLRLSFSKVSICFIGGAKNALELISLLPIQLMSQVFNMAYCQHLRIRMLHMLQRTAHNVAKRNMSRIAMRVVNAQEIKSTKMKKTYQSKL